MPTATAKKGFLETRKECTALLVVVCFAGLVLGAMLIPKSLKVRSADAAQARQLQHQAARDLVAVQHGEYVAQHRAQTEAGYKSLSTAIPPSVDDQSLYASIFAAAAGAGVAPSGASTAGGSSTATGASGHGASPIPMTTGASGPAPAIIAYASTLQSQQRLLSVSSLKFNFALGTVTVTLNGFTTGAPPKAQTTRATARS